jgi:hypothetical protein
MSKLKKLKQKAWWQPGIEVFSQISVLIVFPLLLAIYLGNWLQDRYGHEPWIYIGCVATAFVITNIGLVVITVKASKKMQNISDDNKKEKE